MTKPEYIFRPSQVLQRLIFSIVKPRECKLVKLPWSAMIKVDPKEDLGKSILTLGVYDLVVTETLFRLVKPGDVVADVGANIGYMSSVLSRAVGENGRVFAFEPHPETFLKLKENSQMWNIPGFGRIECYCEALSYKCGNGNLIIPASFSTNSGVPYLTENSVDSKWEDALEVRMNTMDAFVKTNGTCPSLVKIDTEGHEDAVLEGAKNGLLGGTIRNVVFEDHGNFPTKAMVLLSGLGFEVFRIEKRWNGPTISDPSTTPIHCNHEATSYLATKDSDRAIEIFSVRGWQAYQKR